MHEVGALGSIIKWAPSADEPASEQREAFAAGDRQPRELSAPATGGSRNRMQLGARNNDEPRDQQEQQSSGSARTQAPANNCCAGCREPIRDKFIFSVIELHWHQDCVQCADCSLKLDERCYTFDGKLYCRTDYWRRFGPKCFGCRELIDRSELVQRIKGNRVYHLKCFTCNECHKPLKAGEQLHLIDGKRLLCKQDYSQQLAGSKSVSAGKSNGFEQARGGAPQQQQQQQNQQTYYTLTSNQPAAGEKLQAIQQQAKLGRHLLDEEELAEEELDEANLEEFRKDDDDEELDEQAGGNLQNSNQNDDELENEENQLRRFATDDELSAGEQQVGKQLKQRARQSGAQFNQRFLPEGQPQSMKGSPLPEELLAGKAGANLGALVDCGDELVDANGKRRGPRTTIKPKQLETLRHAFETAPKPSRHIREQLASETGLNMRVIQVWFQNRRSKERRMKNSNGSVRRNFFRSSSRRTRVVLTSGANQPAASAANQQSLIAGRSAAASKRDAQQQQQQQQLSPMESGEQLLGAGSQQQPGRQHNSPSEFGGSSSGGFTYFSDSSNQGDAFAINSAGQQAAQQQQQQQTPAQAQYIGANGAQDQANLMALESPSSGGPNSQQANPQQSIRSGSSSSSSNQQYAHQSIKNTPPPPPNIYHAGGQAHPQPPPHMSMAGPLLGPNQVQPAQMGGLAAHQHQQHQLQHQHQHQHSHPHMPLQQQQQHPHQHLANQMVMQPAGPGTIGAMNGLLNTHPQGPSVVQW